MPFDARELQVNDVVKMAGRGDDMRTIRVLNDEWVGYTCNSWSGRNLVRIIDLIGEREIVEQWRNGVQIYPPPAPKWTPKPGVPCVFVPRGYVVITTPLDEGDSDSRDSVCLATGEWSEVSVRNLAPLPQPDLLTEYLRCDNYANFLKSLQERFHFIPKSGRVEGKP